MGRRAALFAPLILLFLAALAALGRVDGEEQRKLYFDLFMHKLNGAERAAMEAIMAAGHYEYMSDFARKYVAQGREEGRAEARARAVLTVLDARDVPLSNPARARILATRDLGLLEAWLRRAVTVASEEQLLEE